MERIKTIKESDFQRIQVLPIHNPPKNFMMLIWLALWSVCGALVLTQLFLANESNTKVICIIYMGFWTYFELLIVRIYRWRKSGKEEIDIYSDKVVINRITSNRGIPVEYQKREIKNVRINKDQKQSLFAKLLFDEYWNMGSETILFDYNGKQLGIGLQLDEQETKYLLRQLQNNRFSL
jgi:hypothetical protein